MPRVQVQNGPNQGLMFQIGKDPITIGRDPSSAIQVLDRGASRYHAEIFQVGEMCFIRDLGSRNGTYVGSEKVTEDLLQQGDIILIGSTRIVFESEMAPPADSGPITVDQVEADDEGDDATGTLELRLEDLAGFDSEDEETDSASNLRAILAVAKIIAEERDEDVLMDKILKYIARIVPADNMYIFLHDLKANNLVPRARYENAPGGPAKISKGIIRRALKERRSILSSNAMADARFKARDSIIINLIRSVLCVPLATHSSVVGVIYMTCDREGECFCEEDLELVSALAAQVALALDNINYRRKQRETYLSTIRTLVALTDLRDPDTHGHSERVCTYAAAIASQLGLGEKDATNVRLVALLHDIGKLALETLHSHGEEFHLTPDSPAAGDSDSGLVLSAGRTLRDHPALGAEIAGNIVGGEGMVEGICHHHELYNGQGYPDGLRGQEIPLAARVVAVADRLDHLTTLGGEHNEGLSMKAALMALDKQAGEEFDPEVVRALHVAHRNGTLFSARSVFGGAEAQPPLLGSPPPDKDI